MEVMVNKITLFMKQNHFVEANVGDFLGFGTKSLYLEKKRTFIIIL